MGTHDRIDTDTEQRPRRAGVLLSIQYLRAVAAILVVFHHARNPLPWLYNPISNIDFGAHGVDIFFVMSGFIMYNAARQESPKEFTQKRLIRIVPLYWAATLLWLGYQLILGWHPLSGTMLKDIAKSLFFIPYYNGTGHIWPFLTPGWTLNYEMFFYLLFGIGLSVRRVVPFATIAVFALVAAGMLFASRDPRWLTYTNPIMIEFIAGIFIAIAYQRYSLRGLAFCLPLGFVILCSSDFIRLPGIPLIGVAAAMIIVGALSMEKQGTVGHHGVLKLLGNASYAIYLFHIPVVAATELFVESYVPRIGLLPLAMMITLGVSGGVAIGIAAHLWVEKPLLRKLKPRSKGRHN